MDLLQMTLESIAAISPETLLWCGRGAAIVVALLALVAALADLRHDFWSMHQAAGERQETIRSQGADLQERIAALSAALSVIAVQRTAMDEQGADPYEAAIRQARNGSPADVLIRACGMSRAEAQLLCRLYGASPPLDGRQPAVPHAL